MGRSWRGRGGVDDFLKLREFLLELVETECQVVGREGFEQGFQTVGDAISNESENRAGEEERDKDEIERVHGGGA